MTTRRRASDRKTARVLSATHPGLPGRSLRDKIQDDLDAAVMRWEEIRDVNVRTRPLDVNEIRAMDKQRGIMRGLAMALAHISVDLEYRPTPLELEKATIRRLRDA